MNRRNFFCLVGVIPFVRPEQLIEKAPIFKRAIKKKGICVACPAATPLSLYPEDCQIKWDEATKDFAPNVIS